MQGRTEMIHLEYFVTYVSDKTQQTVTAKIGYEGPAPLPGHARAFFIPFTYYDGSAEYFIITMETKPRGTADQDQWDSQVDMVPLSPVPSTPAATAP